MIPINNMSVKLDSYINTVNLGHGVNLLTINTFNNHNIHMFYDEVSTTFNDIVKSFWNNYSCKGMNKDNVEMCYKGIKIDNTYCDKKVADLCSTLDKLTLCTGPCNFYHNIKHTDINIKFTYENKELSTDLSFTDGASKILFNIKSLFDIDGNIIIKKNKRIIDVMEIFNCENNDSLVVEKSVDKNNEITIMVKHLTGKTDTIQVNTNDTIQNLKEKVFKSGFIGARLIWAGQVLLDNCTIGDYNIQNESTIHMVLQLRGGMYHETSGKNGNYESLSDIVVYVNMDKKIE